MIIKVNANVQVVREREIEVKVPSFRRTNLLGRYIAVMSPHKVIQVYLHAGALASIQKHAEIKGSELDIDDFLDATEITEAEFLEVMEKAKEQFKLD